MHRVARDSLLFTLVFALRAHIKGKSGKAWALTHDRDEQARRRAAEDIIQAFERSRMEVWQPEPGPWHSTPVHRKEPEDGE